MSTQPVDALELRALEQRRQIQVTAEELKEKISEVREKFDMGRQLRRHFFGVAMVIGAASLLIGTLIARRFER